MTDLFGDRMKLYEGIEADRVFIPTLPIMARLDGKAFHSFLKGVEKPYSIPFIKCMRDTVQYLTENAEAVMGYAQSDEITLLFYSDDIKSQTFFNGRIFKLQSVLASMATWAFERARREHIPDFKPDVPAFFDCRCWQVPSKEEAANVFVWREMDASRNSVLMAGFANFSHKQMHKLSTKTVQDKLLKEAGVNWNDYPPYIKRGVYVQKRRVKKPLTPEILAKIPKKNRPAEGTLFERTEYVLVNWAESEEGDNVFLPLSRAANKVDVVFNGAVPEQYKYSVRDLEIQEM